MPENNPTAYGSRRKEYTKARRKTRGLKTKQLRSRLGKLDDREGSDQMKRALEVRLRRRSLGQPVKKALKGQPDYIRKGGFGKKMRKLAAQAPKGDVKAFEESRGRQMGVFRKNRQDRLEALKKALKRVRRGKRGGGKDRFKGATERD